MAKTRRKKKHPANQLAPPPPGGDKIPRSFIFGRGKLGLNVRLLERDVRKIMMPNTAQRLKESVKNSVKDFLHVAGPLGVTHFLIFSSTQQAPYLRIARTPRGPTLTFKIESYTLSADIAKAQTRPLAHAGIFESAPLVVMNGLGGCEEHLKLITVMFQNMFPAINVSTVQLPTCQRVLLLNHNRETGLIDLRHYLIRAQPVGVSRPIRKLVQRRTLPDLGALEDISEFVNRPGYGSESEVEDEASKVRLAQPMGRGQLATGQSAVKLQEIGPRMSLRLLKVEEGMCNGVVMFHQFVKRSEEEMAAQKASVAAKKELKAKRKKEQEANVRRKK